MQLTHECAAQVQFADSNPGATNENSRVEVRLVTAGRSAHLGVLQALSRLGRTIENGYHGQVQFCVESHVSNDDAMALPVKPFRRTASPSPACSAGDTVRGY